MIPRRDLAKPQTLIPRLAEARERTDELFRLLRPEALYDRPIAERHRNIFYLGHLEAFDWNLLANRAFGLRTFHPEFDKLFAFGIDPVSGRRLPDDQPQDWPSVEEISQYNRRVREQLGGALEAVASACDANPQLATLLNVAIEHRLMHAETFAYIVHQLPFDRKISAETPAVTTGQPVAHGTVEIPPGEATLGLRPNGALDFGWDNEFEMHRVYVPAFAIDAHKVTNADFLKFVDANGYENQALWTENNWKWITAQALRHPGFWVKKGSQWFQRTMFAEVPLPLDWPVYVSHAEASAFARWKGESLPTEAEWHPPPMEPSKATNARSLGETSLHSGRLVTSIFVNGTRCR